MQQLLVINEVVKYYGRLA